METIISEDGKYRYTLHRKWDATKPCVMFIMLNPSTADAKNDDPTIRRCIDFAKKWGYGSLCVGNLFAFRATNPKELLKCDDPIGCMNLFYIEAMSEVAESIVCAWGNSKVVDKICAKYTDYKPLKKLSKLYYLEYSKNGTPKHPLYLKGNLKISKIEVTISNVL